MLRLLLLDLLLVFAGEVLLLGDLFGDVLGDEEDFDDDDDVFFLGLTFRFALLVLLLLLLCRIFLLPIVAVVEVLPVVVGRSEGEE